LIFVSRLHVRARTIVALLFAASIATASAAEIRPRDKLLEIVTNCLGAEDPAYCDRCFSPRIGSACAKSSRCEDTTEVWAMTGEFVAIRDRKMCGCPSGFVHGLAVPRAPVRGVEAPDRPDGIWAFAWAVAQERIGDDQRSALLVNSAWKRSQDQLHVHVVRLRDTAREGFVGRRAVVRNLPEVWAAAKRLAAIGPPMKDYGVLVASDPQGGFMVLVTQMEDRIEGIYAEERCR
jgi:CDP-diacylglycerol pyrophosphatase